ncbi:hypothetical protein J437_LFUL014440 [Ladona fulva]|uniref:HTH CENPB-type domain-containing protein n=1 Tax=Ladona fulva TaxID=123851 RepID=A0A8K0P3S5_LADFU|nr:hypothetical protein J437_LFUL014440 [Ladona fulva]
MEEIKAKTCKSYMAQFKLEVISFTKENGNCAAGRKFNVNEASKLHRGKRAMCYRKCLWPTLEKDLYDWVMLERSRGIRLSTTQILLRATQIACEKKIIDFKEYPSWGFQFMRRNNLSVHASTSNGEKLPIDWEAKVIKFRQFVKESIFRVKKMYVGNMDKVFVSFDLPTARMVNLKVQRKCPLPR